MPNSTSPDKMEIAGYLMDPNFSNEMKPGLYNAIAIARQKDPTDWSLFEIEQAQLSQNGTPEAYRKIVTDFYNSNQQNPIAVYHMGCMTWKFGDANSGLQYLNQAAALAPQEMRFAKTLSKAKQSVPPTKICTYSISFRPQDF